MKLDKIFKPKTIAVIGASNEKGSVGYALFDNLIKSKFQGAVYPVNIKRKKIQGHNAYKSVKDIGRKIDLAIIATPALTVPGVVKDCGEAGVGGIVIISAGFSEIGKNGQKLTDEILKYKDQYNLKIIGPNTLGFLCPFLNLNASFARHQALSGNVAFISQSGALCTAILDWSIKNNVGFRYFVSIGDMADVEFHDLIDYFARDPEVSSILIYMESVKDARKFLSAARSFSKSKPIIVLKVGRSTQGAKAAQSHTGSLAGNDQIFDAAFERAGIVRVDTVVGLFHAAKILAMQARPEGKRIAVVTNAGGPGVIATDSLIYSGGELSKFSKTTMEKLNKILPKAWSHNNPVDILGDADPERYEKAVEICLKDKSVDAVLVILTPQAMTDPSKVAEAIARLNRQTDKTLFASWMGGYDVFEGRRILERGNVPVFRQPEDAVKSFMYIYKYTENIKLLQETPATIPHAFTPKISESKILIKKILDEGRDSLTEVEAKELLRDYEIPVVDLMVAKSPQEAAQYAVKIGFPAVMKILSPDIMHKTDIGGVVLNIKSADEAKAAFNKIMISVRTKNPKAKIEGILIEPMLNKKYELIIGSKKDPIFGPVIIFGMGGVAVEVFKDTCIGLPPLNMALALHLIEKTKIYKLLKGYRNMPGVDIASIQFLLYKIAYLIADFPEIKELDLNPIGVDEHGAIVLDAKILLDKEVAKQNLNPYEHLVISPYPKEFMEKAKLKNGLKILIRPSRPEDENELLVLFNSFSTKTKKLYFFKKMENITRELTLNYTQIDYDREITLVAETAGKKRKLIGLANLKMNFYNSSGEMDMVVGDHWQFEDLGSTFADCLIKIAKRRKIYKIYAYFSKNNKPMANILEKRGFKLENRKESEYGELQLA